MPMVCRNCGAGLKQGKKFCVNCGVLALPPPAPFTQSSVTCRSCGAPLEKGKQFCGRCGGKAYSEAEPRREVQSPRWAAGWEPPHLSRLVPPPPPPVGKVFPLTVTGLGSTSGLPLARRWGKALLLSSAGLIILPAFDLAFLGEAQRGIGLVVAVIGIVLAIVGTAVRRPQTSSIATVQQPHSIPASWQGQQRIPSSGQPARTTPLTEFEQRILSLVVQGHSDQQIAQGLSLPISILNQHLFGIKRKAGRFDRAELINWAVDQGVGPDRAQE